MPDSAVVIARVRCVTWTGLVLNVLLAAAKAVGGWLCSSHALIADAVHSLSDLVTDAAVLLGVRYWAAPADDEHPYGHGKIEALVTLFIALALALVAWELGVAAVKGLIAHETALKPDLAAFGIAVVSVVVKEVLYRWTHHVAQEVHSTALEANAWHHRSDALSSIPVAIALALSVLVPSLVWADAVGALLVGCFILRVSWELGRSAVQELIDAGIDAKAERVEAVAMTVAGVRGVHQVRARRYGGSFQADLHVQVEATLSISEAHGLAHRVKDAVLGAGLDVTDVVIHVEPYRGAD